jgi:hypothetical protein
MLGLASVISCADDELRASAAAARRSLLPFAIGSGEERYILAHFSIVGGFIGVQVLVVIFTAVVRARGEPFLDVCSRARFPAWSISVFDALSQGLALEGVRLVGRRLEGGPEVIVCGAIGIAMCVVHCAFGTWAVRWAVPEEGFYAEYGASLDAAPAPIRRLVAQGRWGPARLQQRLGAYFNSWRPGCLWMTHLTVCRPLFLGILANLDAPSAALCTAQFAVLGAVAGLTGLLMLVARPYRAPGRSLFSGLVGVVNGVILGSPAIPGAHEAVGPLIFASSVLCVVSICATLALNGFEKLWMKKREPKFDSVAEYHKCTAKADDTTTAPSLLPHSPPVLDEPLLHRRRQRSSDAVDELLQWHEGRRSGAQGRWRAREPAAATRAVVTAALLPYY